MSPLIAALHQQHDELYYGPAWHGPSLRAALRGIPVKDASQRMSQRGHSIAEIALHCAYWKYAVRRRLVQSDRGKFPWKGSNWFDLPDPLSEKHWKDILKLLDEQHELLGEVIKSFPESKLQIIPPGSKTTNLRTIQGIAAHDAYHAGQIRMLKPKRS